MTLAFVRFRDEWSHIRPERPGAHLAKSLSLEEVVRFQIGTPLPFADASVDLVTCSQLLHHFDDREIPRVLRELDRVARGHVIVSDLRRSWLAACGFWLVSWPLAFSRVTRHDGTLSVLRGFTAAELSRHIQLATGRRATVRRHLGWRLTASWEKCAV